MANENVALDPLLEPFRGLYVIRANIEATIKRVEEPSYRSLDTEIDDNTAKSIENEWDSWMYPGAGRSKNTLNVSGILKKIDKFHNSCGCLQVTHAKNTYLQSALADIKHAIATVEGMVAVEKKVVAARRHPKSAL